MKKDFLPLIVSAVVVIALGSSLAALLLSEQPQEEPVSSSELQEGAVLIDKNNYDIDKIRITTPKSSFTIRNMGALSFRVDELDTAPQDDDLLLSAAGSASSLTAIRTVRDEEADLSAYGLSSPSAIVQIDYTAPDTLTLLLGDEAPGGAGRYAMLQGTPSVYLVDSDRIAVFLRPMEDYVTLSLTAFPGFDQRITSVELSGGTRSEPVVLTPSYTQPEGDAQAELSGYAITAPKERESYSQSGIAVINSVFGVTADSVAVFTPDAQALAAYGMNEPYAKISAVLTEGEPITLLASKPDAQGICYLMREGVPVIYRIQSTSLPWLDARYQDFLSRDMITATASEVKTIAITQGEETDTFRLTHSDEGMKVTLNGKTIPPQDFLQTYEKLLAISGEEYTDSDLEVDASEVANVSVTYTDPDRKSVTLRFYDAASRRVFISRAGIMEFTCRKSLLTALLDSVKELSKTEQSSDAS